MGKTKKTKVPTDSKLTAVDIIKWLDHYLSTECYVVGIHAISEFAYLVKIYNNRRRNPKTHTFQIYNNLNRIIWTDDETGKQTVIAGKKQLRDFEVEWE